MEDRVCGCRDDPVEGSLQAGGEVICLHCFCVGEGWELACG